MYIVATGIEQVLLSLPDLLLLLFVLKANFKVVCCPHVP